jgi:ATP-binding cassette subfamily B (MDR/TAP) protein 1
LIVQSLSTSVVGIIIAMTANWQLALIVLCFLPCVIAQSYAQGRLMRGFGADAKVLILFTRLYHIVVIC